MKQLILSFLTIVFSFGVFAAEEVVVKKTTTTTVTTETKTEVVPEKKSDDSFKSKLENVFEKTKSGAAEAGDKVAKQFSETRTRREQNDYFVLLNYSALDLVIPSKYGATAGWKSTTDKTWELEYLRASISVPFVVKDLGSLTEQRISLIRRSYGVNSFNFNYGLSYFSMKLHIGDELLNKISGSYPSYDIVDLSSVGFNVGLGNRWIFEKNITVGIDWFEWSQPVFVLNKKSAYLDYATDPEDRDDMETAIKVLSYFPRLTVAKVQFGMSF